MPILLHSDKKVSKILLLRLNLNILLLVRDPRGILQSRQHRHWCPGNPDCDQPENLCSDLVSDYRTAQKLLQEFPFRFR